jgi:hypothetical protein
MTTYTVSSGVTSNLLDLVAGDTETVLSGGTANFIYLENYGVMYLNGTADGMTIGADSVMVNGGSATGGVVSSTGLEELTSGGVAIGSVVSNGGDETVGSGATVTIA